MFKLISKYIFSISLFFFKIQAESTEISIDFHEVYHVLDNSVPTFLDLKIQKLDTLLTIPKEIYGIYIEEKPDYYFSRIESLGFWFGTCKKETYKIVFTIYLPYQWEKENEYTFDSKSNKEKMKFQSKNEILKDKTMQLIFLTQKHIHESFSLDNALIFFMAPLTENSSEKELILKYENGIALYQEAFFKTN